MSRTEGRKAKNVGMNSEIWITSPTNLNLPCLGKKYPNEIDILLSIKIKAASNDLGPKDKLKRQ